MKIFKPLFFVISIFSFSLYSYAVNPVSSPVYPTEVNKPVNPGKERMRQQLQWFANLTVKQYEQVKGKKLNFFERVTFKLNQRRAKQMLKHYYWDEPTTWQKISWLFKGLILGPIALILGYIFFRDEERELIKWIWIGFAGWCAIVAIILLTAA
jgi:hypothetical protein